MRRTDCEGLLTIVRALDFTLSEMGNRWRVFSGGVI